MPSETELERMLVRLIGDSTEYQKMFKDAERQARNSMAQINKDVDRTEGAFKRLAGGVQAFGGAITGVGQKTAMLGGVLTAAAAPLMLFGQQSFQASVKMESLMLGLTATVGSAEKAQGQLKELKEVAKLPGLGLEEAVEGAIGLQQVGFEAGKTTRILKAFGNAVATTGGGRNELGRILTQLTQMQSAGKVLSADLRPILQTAPLISRAMKEAFGTVSTDAIGKQKIGSEEFINRLLTQLEKMPAVAGGTANTMENLGDSMRELMVTIGDELKVFVLPAMNKLAEIVVYVTTTLKQLSPEMRTALTIAGLVAVSVGPAIVALGGLIGMVGFAITGIGVVISTVIAAGTALVGAVGGAIAFILTPLGAVVTALVAIGVAVSAIVVAMIPWKGIWDSLVKTVPGFLANWQENLQILIEYLKPWTDAVLNMFWSIVDTLEGLIGNFVTYASGFRSFAMAVLGFFWNLQENIGRIFSWIGESWWDILDDMLKGLLQFISNWISNIGTGVKTVFRLFTAWGGWINGMFRRVFTLDFLKWIWDGIKKAGEAFGKFATAAWEKLKSIFTGRKFSMNDLLDAMQDDFDKGAQNVNFLGTAADIIQDEMKNLKGPLEGFSSEALKKLELKTDFEGIGDALPKFKFDIEEPEKIEEGKRAVQEVTAVADEAGKKVGEIFNLENTAVREGTSEYRKLVADSLSLLEKQPTKDLTGGRDQVYAAIEATKQVIENPGQSLAQGAAVAQDKAQLILTAISEGIGRLVTLEEDKENQEEEGLGLASL